MTIQDRLQCLDGVRRVVLKLGTRMITSGPYTLDTEALARLSLDIADLRNSGYEVIIVSSGAIGAGMGRMRFRSRPKAIPQLQALASIGQNLLMNAFEKALGMYNIPIAQVLLTIDDINNRKRFVNVQNTMTELLQMQVVPVINENDSVGTEEVKVGDNDNIASYVASLVNADLLVIFTDVDGLYDRKPGSGGEQVIPLVREITPEIETLAGGSGDMAAVGGMRTKVEAAKRVMSGGGRVIIANGRTTRLSELLAGSEKGTLFCPHDNGLDSRSHWIATAAKVRGKIVVDDGAVKALGRKGASLLPSGIVSAEGVFDIGDVVAVVDGNGNEIARGVTQYNSTEIDIIKGMQSKEIDNVLGYSNGKTVIHRNDMVYVK